jgi:hypothetical protein
MPPGSPPLGPLRAPSSGFTRGCPRAAPGCASRFAPQPPGAPQPRALGGREGARAGLVCARACSAPAPAFYSSPAPDRGALPEPRQLQSLSSRLLC